MASSGSQHPRLNTFDSSELASSNDTASDLPGPGRNLGNLYKFCGKRVERAIRTLSKLSGRDRSSRAEAIQTLNSSSPGVAPRRTQNIFPGDIVVFELQSSNDTTDNIPGAGRNLGNFYQFGGRYVEHAISALVKRRGCGPRVVSKRIQVRDWNYSGGRYHGTQYEEEQRKDCKKLIDYTKCIKTLSVCPNPSDIVLWQIQSRVYSKTSTRGNPWLVNRKHLFLRDSEGFESRRNHTASGGVSMGLLFWVSCAHLTNYARLPSRKEVL